MNLKYMKVSLFEITYKKKITFHNILIYWDTPVSDDQRTDMQIQKILDCGKCVILLVFELLDCAKTLECSVHHDGQSCAESFTFLHAVDLKKKVLFIILP